MSHWQEKKVLVSGGAGFIGSHLTQALVRLGAQVIVLDDLSVGTRKNLEDCLNSPLCQLVEGSILDAPLVERWSEGVEVIFHLAVVCLRRSFDDPQQVHRVNTEGTLNLLEAARQRAPQLQRFLYCSSSEVYGSALTAPMDEGHPCRPTTLYGASKLAGEFYTSSYSLSYGLPITIARPFNTYGPREHHQGASGEVIPRFAVRIANGLPPGIFGSGQQTRDFTYVTDTVQGLLRAAESEATLGQAFNIARGQEVSIGTLAQHLLRKMKRPDLQPQFLPTRPADVERHYASADKLFQSTGWRAEVGIEEGLELYLQWFAQQSADPKDWLEEVTPQNW